MEPSELESGAVDWRDEPLAALIEHIVGSHHAYLRGELPRLAELAERVATEHGEQQPDLLRVRSVFDGLQRELTSHMGKEEQILFPMIEQAEAAGALPQPFEGPIAQMEHEHDNAGAALGELRSLTEHYQPPPDACDSHRALLQGLAELDDDLRLHIHKENNILFPRAQGR